MMERIVAGLSRDVLGFEYFIQVEGRWYNNVVLRIQWRSACKLMTILLFGKLHVRQVLGLDCTLGSIRYLQTQQQRFTKLSRPSTVSVRVLTVFACRRISYKQPPNLTRFLLLIMPRINNALQQITKLRPREKICYTRIAKDARCDPITLVRYY